MRISVVLCVYNGERFLPRQLESIARQARSPDEMIVSDDGSTDGSMAILEAFASRVAFPVRSTRNPSNLGVAKNFEQAISLAEEGLIVTSDQDDVWSPEKLARIENEFDKAPEVGLVFSDADLIGADDEPLGTRLWPSVRFTRSSRRELVEGDPFRVLLRRPVITGATMAFRSELRGRLLPIAPGWIHDEWIGLMAAASSKIVAIADPLMQYRRHAQNQVGVLGINAAGRARTSLARPRAVLLERAEAFEAFLRVLAERCPERPDLISRVERKIAHDRARGRLPVHRIGRIPGIVRELATFGYARYSGHPLSFVRDFLARD